MCVCLQVYVFVCNEREGDRANEKRKDRLKGRIEHIVAVVMPQLTNKCKPFTQQFHNVIVSMWHCFNFLFYQKHFWIASENVNCFVWFDMNYSFFSFFLSVIRFD